LFDPDADVDAQEEDGGTAWTALHLASSDGHLDIAKLLINFGEACFGYLEVTHFLIESGVAATLYSSWR
jgi:ankyrin repeat protein